MGESVDPRAALSEAEPSVLWLDTTLRPDPGDPLADDAPVDLLIVGAGFTGLWAALQSKEEDPARSVMIIDSGRVAEQASSRNGGFCSSSLTHGLENGAERFGREQSRIEAVAAENFDELESTIERYGIDCDWHRVGGLSVATAPWLVDGLHESVELANEFGLEAEFLDRDAVRAELDSPTYHAGVWQHRGEALVDPARLAWGLADAVRSLGVTIHESTPMIDLDRVGGEMRVRTATGTIRCNAVILATNGFRSPVKAINRMVAPVYDYVLATEPLSAAQLDSIGWGNRQGLSDTTNQFHYYRITEDDRILWGGYDAVYHYGSRIDPSLDQCDETHGKLAEHFFETFPQLEGLRFSHRWGGVIDTCTRFSVGFGSAFGGSVVYAAGYTGLGVGATRFGARVCLDLLFHPTSPLLELDLVRSKPLPFPPEPARFLGIELTRRALAKADANRGRRGPWLRLLDSVGLGFDS